MKRRLWAYAVCLLCVVVVKAEKPNVVLILIDDLGWSDLGCYGNKAYKTPNLDRLALLGMRFTKAYAAAPVCSPTRASILTGKYPARLRLTEWIPGLKPRPIDRLVSPSYLDYLPLTETTIAEQLKQAGYVTASIGKWHLGDGQYRPERQGFDINVAGNRRGSTPGYFCPLDLPNVTACSPGEYLTDYLTRRAEEFIEAHKSKPFFLYLPHFAVHTPLQAKQDLVAKYQSKGSKDSPLNPVYAAMIESMDESVGRIMRKVEESGIAHRTVILFTADNGGLLFEGRNNKPVTTNAPLRSGKGHLYEGGIREPLIVRWPGIVEAGTLCEVPVISTDFYPTILEIAGIPNRQALDGVSLVPLLRKTGSLTRGALYWHYPHYSPQGGKPSSAIQSEHYKLIEFYEDGALELYNLRTDIGEQINLAAKMRGKTRELHRRLKEWRQAVGARLPAANTDYRPPAALSP